MPSDRWTRFARPRLDLTLVAFAAAGAAVALLVPPRAPATAPGGAYALAISAGDDLKLAATAAAGSALDAPAHARVLACRRVMSVGPVDIGARCKPSAAPAGGLAQGD